MLSKSNRLTLWILIAMVIGIAVGYTMHTNMEEGARKDVADNLKLQLVLNPDWWADNRPVAQSRWDAFMKE